MIKPNFFRSKQGSKSRRRRPTGMSRRQRRQNLGFETLEDRRVMSAGSVLPSDPLFDQQFFLLNVGQQVGTSGLQPIFGEPGEDINLIGARSLGFTGAGVNVAVLDTGVQFDHPDLNINPDLSFNVFTQGIDANPDLPVFDPDFPIFFPFNAQGTAVAGIIAAQDNGIGTVGIAPDASIVPVLLNDTLAAIQTPQNLIDALRFVGSNDIDIANISFGDATFGEGAGLGAPRQIVPLTPGELLALSDATIGPNAGRGGLGTIFVVPAGNDAALLDSANFDGLVNSRFTIAVTGVDEGGNFNNDDGTVTNFPEAGTSVLVAAFVGSNAQQIGDDPGIGSGIVTTDTTGSTGFNIPPDPDNGQEFDRDFQPDESVTSLFGTSQFGGTTAAAAQVSGIVALVLEANPNLSFRDVQEILVRSARHPSANTTQATGLDIALGNIPVQNPQIINQIPLFRDPDVFDPTIPNFLQIVRPIADPRFTGTTTGVGLAADPARLTNGAGFVVSQGLGSTFESTGLGFGIVDAELAILLAQQWTTQGQTLADELSFTTTLEIPPTAGVANNIPAAFVQDDLDLIIPGGLGGADDFGQFFDEFFVPTPPDGPGPDFSDQPSRRGIPLELTVPQVNGNDIIVESVDILLDITGGAEALDHLRVVLVSPNGTQSELNHAFVDPSLEAEDGDVNLPQSTGVRTVNGFDGFSGVDLDAGSISAGNLTATFNTVRNRGERSDDAIIFDPLTNEPFVTAPTVPPLFGLPIAQAAGNQFNGVPSTVGDLVSRGWQLHFENFGPTSLALNNVEIVWHGQPVGANTERVQGSVGLDDNQDDLFNFSRVIQTTFDIDGDPTVTRLGEIENLIDPNQESFASNVTVSAFLDADPNDGPDVNPDIDILVDQFLTGADGNYYFDLVPGDYIITTDDPRAVEDEITPDGFLPEFRTSWQINEDFFTPFDFDVNLEVPVTVIDGVETPSPFLDGSGNQVVSGIRNLNFLLDPGAAAANEANFSGVIFADFDGDGIFNGDDINVPNITVFADTNENGQFDAGETFTQTDENGVYNLIVETDDVDVIDIGVITPVDFIVAAPNGSTAIFEQNGIPSTLTFDAENSTYSFFTQPGDELTGVDFAIQPPFASDGGGVATSTGIILGTVFNDADGNQLRGASEQGFANTTVFIDSNNNSTLEPGEVSTTTNVNGSFIFTEVPAGQHFIRIANAPSSLIQTTPVSFPIGSVSNAPNVVTLSPGGTATGISFGLFNSAELDFGDLPAIFNLTTLADDGARSLVGNGFHFLGSPADTELDGFESPTANGDDTNLNDDEDGIVFTPLSAGDQATNGQGQITVDASNSSGFLQGWIDFNGDGDFLDAGEQIIQNLQVAAGESVVSFELPDVIADPATSAAGGIFARFRYGSFNQGLTGLDVIGEVEDYLVPVGPPPEPLVAVNPDFNDDGVVNGLDFLAFQLGDASNAGLQAIEDAYGQSTAPQALLAIQNEEDSSDTIEPAAVLQNSSFASGIASTVQLSAVESGLLANTITTEETLLESVAPTQSTPSFNSIDSAFGNDEESEVFSLNDSSEAEDEEATLAEVFGEEIDWRL